VTHHHPDHIGFGGLVPDRNTGQKLVTTAPHGSYRADADAGPARDTVAEALAFVSTSWSGYGRRAV